MLNAQALWQSAVFNVYTSCSRHQSFRCAFVSTVLIDVYKQRTFYLKEPTSFFFLTHKDATLWLVNRNPVGSELQLC